MTVGIKASRIAQQIKDMADQLGWKIYVRGNVLTITKAIVVGSKESFADADGEYYSILGLLTRTSPGSDWGTDGGGVGGMVAIRTGLFVMNRSGGNKNILRHLERLC